MKKLFFVAIIAAAVLTACFMELAYVHNTFNRLNTDIEALITAIEKDNDVGRAETLEMINDINDYWENRKRLVQVMLNHLLLLEYDAKITRLKSDMEVGDANLTRIDAAQLHSMTKELKELYTPHFHNIF